MDGCDDDCIQLEQLLSETVRRLELVRWVCPQNIIKQQRVERIIDILRVVQKSKELPQKFENRWKVR